MTRNSQDYSETCSTRTTVATLSDALSAACSVLHLTKGENINLFTTENYDLKLLLDGLGVTNRIIFLFTSTTANDSGLFGILVRASN